MTIIGQTIVISFILSLISAVGITFRQLSVSNTVGGKEGTAEDFLKDGHGVIFYETCDGKKR